MRIKCPECGCDMYLTFEPDNLGKLRCNEFVCGKCNKKIKLKEWSWVYLVQNRIRH